MGMLPLGFVCRNYWNKSLKKTATEFWNTAGHHMNILINSIICQVIRTVGVTYLVIFVLLHVTVSLYQWYGKLWFIKNVLFSCTMSYHCPALEAVKIDETNFKNPDYFELHGFRVVSLCTLAYYLHLRGKMYSLSSIFSRPLSGYEVWLIFSSINLQFKVLQWDLNSLFLNLFMEHIYDP